MSEGGVSRYIKTSVDIYFPEGHMGVTSALCWKHIPATSAGERASI